MDIPSRLDTIRQHKADGGRIAAVLPVHYSRALLRAFGYLPVEVWGPPGRNTTKGDAHVQAYACSIVRSSLSFLLSGGLDTADVVVVPHACDSLQGLGSMLLDFIRPDQAVLPLYIPRGEGGPGTVFLARELAQQAEMLAERTGSRPNDDTLMAAIAREEEADIVLNALFDARPGLDLDDSTFFDVARSREYLPAERFVDLGREALTHTGTPRGVPMILSGIVPEPRTVIDVIGEAGGLIVANDLACFGRRRYPVGTSDEPFTRMAERLLGGPPDSTLGSPIAARADHLIEMAEQFGARAVVFVEVKFCEPEAFYLPILHKRLGNAGLRTLTVELDVSDALPHQVVTRLEALLETIP